MTEVEGSLSEEGNIKQSFTSLYDPHSELTCRGEVAAGFLAPVITSVWQRSVDGDHVTDVLVKGVIIVDGVHLQLLIKVHVLQYNTVTHLPRLHPTGHELVHGELLLIFVHQMNS